MEIHPRVYVLKFWPYSSFSTFFDKFQPRIAFRKFFGFECSEKEFLVLCSGMHDFSEKHSKLLKLQAVLVPRPLEKEENDLVLDIKGTKGIEFKGNITANTYSEKLNFTFTVQSVSAIVETGLLAFYS